MGATSGVFAAATSTASTRPSASRSGTSSTSSADAEARSSTNRLACSISISRPLREDPAARGYFQSSADLARGLEINDSPLGSLSPELIREFLQLRAERRRAA